MEEKNALKEEVETLNEKHYALADEELGQVNGGEADNARPPRGMYIRCGTPGCKNENWRKISGIGEYCVYCNRRIQIRFVH